MAWWWTTALTVTLHVGHLRSRRDGRVQAMLYTNWHQLQGCCSWGGPVSDATDFRSLAGALQYLTFTRPDIAYAVQQVCLHMHDPREPHLAALKRILRYVRGTLHLGLLLRPTTSADLVVYTDADWAGCPDTRRSTSGYAVFLGDNLVS